MRSAEAERCHRRKQAGLPRDGGAVTLIEAAALLGVTPDNLRGAIKRGSLKARKVGRDWTVTAREVERYRVNHRRAV
jgi:excisionase family DNA binding protein